MAEGENERELGILERRFSVLAAAPPTNWDFFRGLAAYVKEIEELPLAREIARSMERNQAAARSLTESLNAKVFEELNRSAAVVLKIADEQAKKLQPMMEVARRAEEQLRPMMELAKRNEEALRPILGAARRVEEQLQGLIGCSDPIRHLDSSLFGVARALRDAGLAEKMSRFELHLPEPKNIYGDYSFAPSYEKYEQEKRRFERQQDVEPWGAWENVTMVRRLVYEPDQYREDIRAELKEKPQGDREWVMLNFSGVVAEMECVREDEDPREKDVVLFRVAPFRAYAQRVHGHITSELLRGDGFGKPSYDDSTGALTFHGKAIPLSARGQSFPRDLARLIFSSGDLGRAWNTDEIQELWDDPKAPSRRPYQAALNLNRAIARATAVGDFLVVTTKTVRINPKYLKG